MTVLLTGEQVKKKFQAKGETFTTWATDNGYKYQAVMRVVNGSAKCVRGTSHEIAVALGMKAKPEENSEVA